VLCAADFIDGSLQHGLDVVLSAVSWRMAAIRVEHPDDRGDVSPTVEHPPVVLLPLAGEHLGGSCATPGCECVSCFTVLTLRPSCTIGPDTDRSQLWRGAVTCGGERARLFSAHSVDQFTKDVDVSQVPR
jgi:hypothetical protein